jgi:excisionase family DNA binding protein
MEPIAVSCIEAGRLLCLSKDTVERLVRDGHLPRVPHLGVIRIPVAAIRRFAEQQAA